MFHFIKNELFDLCISITAVIVMMNSSLSNVCSFHSPPG